MSADYTAKAAAKLLGISHTSVIHLCRIGVLAHTRFGSVYCVDAASLHQYRDAFIAAQQAGVIRRKRTL